MRHGALLGRSLGTLLGALLLAGPAAAQYKVVAPDGRITYTDRPSGDSSARVSPMRRDGSINEAKPGDTLPPELRQLATRFPVTLYSTADCPPCDAGRQLLQQRGVPFTEKLIVSEDDAAAMTRLVGTRSVPALTIGAQALRGLSESEWASYLDLAGYPRASKLPKGWQAPASAPLVSRPAAGAASAPLAGAAPARALPAPEVEPPPAPGGIRF